MFIHRSGPWAVLLLLALLVCARSSTAQETSSKDLVRLSDPSLAFPSSTSAQVGEPASGSSGWAFQLTPYLWMGGFDGTLKIRNQTVPVSASFSEIFDNLNLGFMCAFDARKGRWGILLDTVYLNLAAKNTLGQTSIQIKTDNKLFFLDPEAYYRVVTHPRGSVDALVGLSYWHSGNSLTITPPAVRFEKGRDWVDPILGGRFKLNLTRRFFTVFKGDVGGFGAGSQLTYQLFAGGGAEFKDKFALIAGYRRIYVDLGSSGLLHDYAINGLALGFGIKFGQK